MKRLVSRGRGQAPTSLALNGVPIEEPWRVCAGARTD